MPKNKYTKMQPKGKFIWKTMLGDHGGCGYIRVIYPSLLINQFAYKNARFTSEYGMMFSHDPSYYKYLMFLKFQRAATDDHLKTMQYMRANVCTQAKTGILYEADDLLSPDIPKSNYAYEYYNHYFPYIEEMLRMVDGITVSTEPLRNALLKYNPNIQVLPNHLCRFLWGEYPGPKVKETSKPTIMYAGSQNHFPDKKYPEVQYGDIGPELMKFIIGTTDRFNWVFVGGLPFQLIDVVKQGKMKYLPWQMINNLPRVYADIGADIGIAPLEKNDFNECKSNLKALEYCALGVPGVYSDSYPYKKLMMASGDELEFISNIERMASDPDLRKRVVEHDYDLLKKDLYWEDNDNILRHINRHLRLFGKELA